MTIQHGKVVVEDGQLTAAPTDGRRLKPSRRGGDPAQPGRMTWIRLTTGAINGRLPHHGARLT